MAIKIFISFRFSDGKIYKEQLVDLFNELDYTIDKSEDKDRSGLSDDTIQKYLYGKLKDTSLTIVILTPEAINYKTNFDLEKKADVYDDWLYDELRYSLEDRNSNRTNGVIALYTSDAKSELIARETSSVTTIFDFENLVRKICLILRRSISIVKMKGIIII